MKRAHRVAAVALTVLVVVGALAIAPARALATFPGSTGRIAFDDFVTNQVFTVNPDGSGLVQLTHEPSGYEARWPNWSSDGSHLLFVRFNRSNNMGRIWAMNADGSHQHQVASDAPGYRDYQPHFTPDARHIVFSRCKPNNGVCAIWVMRADGTGKQAITGFKEGTREATDSDPTVSPDGRHVAYTAFGQNGITAQIRIVGLDGGGNHAATPPALEGGRPDWSPDGTRITFTSNRPGIHSNVYTMAADGTDITRLTHTAFPNDSFASVYSPDGAQIAFSNDRRYPDLCCEDLFVMNADGSQQHLVRTGLLGILDAAWGPASPVRAPADGG